MKQTWKLVALLAGLGISGCEGETLILERATSAAGLVTFSESSIDFGMSDCGGEAPEARTVTIKNDGDAAVRWVASLDSTEFFTVVGASSGVLEPGSQGSLTVSARSMPSDVAAGTVMSATLTVRTDDTLESLTFLPLKVRAQGASFEIVSPDVADFGQVPVGKEAPEIPVVLRNVGNAPGTVAVSKPPDPQFAFSWDGDDEGVELAPGETLSGLAAHFTPSDIKPSLSASVLAIDGPVCGQSVAKIDVRGQGLAGVAGVSPANVDLGEVPCGTQAGARKVTIYNNGNAVLGWSASLASGEHYTLSLKDGAIAPGELAEVVVTPKPMEMTTKVEKNGFGDTLTITTDTGVEPFEIPIKQTAYGAILQWSSDAALEFEAQTMFVASDGKALALENSGSAQVEVEVGGGQFAVTPDIGKIDAGGGKLELSVAFKPEQFEPVASSLTVSTDGPLCQPLPGSIPVSGAGGKGAASAISVGGHGILRRGFSASIQGGCAILANSEGRVACWGNNSYGQLGVSGTKNAPVIVPNLSGIVQIASGGDYNCAVDKDGAIWCWGNNLNSRGNRTGKLGVTNVNSSTTPVKVVTVPEAAQVACGKDYACAVTKAGTVWCWGSDRRGQLGTGGHNSHNYAPRQLSNFTDITEIDIGGGGGCALRNDNTLWCWGYYTKGQIGTGSSSGTTTRAQVSGITNAFGLMQIEDGGRGGARCALRMDGTVYCWGNRRYGQIGNGSDTSSGQTTPVAVSNISTATAVAGYHLGGCALLNDQTIRCWGRNQNGQVGNGTTSARTTPIAVSGISDATAIAAGGQGACAIVTGGSVKCWGHYGFDSSSTPVTLPHF